MSPEQENMQKIIYDIIAYRMTEIGLILAKIYSNNEQKKNIKQKSNDGLYTIFENEEDFDSDEINDDGDGTEYSDYSTSVEDLNDDNINQVLGNSNEFNPLSTSSLHFSNKKTINNSEKEFVDILDAIIALKNEIGHIDNKCFYQRYNDIYQAISSEINSSKIIHQYKKQVLNEMLQDMDRIIKNNIHDDVTKESALNLVLGINHAISNQSIISDLNGILAVLSRVHTNSKTTDPKIDKQITQLLNDLQSMIKSMHKKTETEFALCYEEIIHQSLEIISHLNIDNSKKTEIISLMQRLNVKHNLEENPTIPQQQHKQNYQQNHKHYKAKMSVLLTIAGLTLGIALCTMPLGTPLIIAGACMIAAVAYNIPKLSRHLADDLYTNGNRSLLSSMYEIFGGNHASKKNCP